MLGAAATCIAAWESYLPPDEVLQHRALPRALAAHHGDLGQVQVRVLTDGGEGILHAVHQRNQILHSPVPHLCDAPGSLSSLSEQGGISYFFSPRHPSRFFGGGDVLVCAHTHRFTCRFPPSLTAPPRWCVRSPQRGLSPPTNMYTPLHQAPQGSGGRERMISCIFSGEIPAVLHTHRSVVTLILYICTVLPAILCVLHVQ